MEDVGGWGGGGGEKRWKNMKNYINASLLVQIHNSKTKTQNVTVCTHSWNQQWTLAVLYTLFRPYGDHCDPMKITVTLWRSLWPCEDYCDPMKYHYLHAQLLFAINEQLLTFVAKTSKKKSVFWYSLSYYIYIHIIHMALLQFLCILVLCRTLPAVTAFTRSVLYTGLA